MGGDAEKSLQIILNWNQIFFISSFISVAIINYVYALLCRYVETGGIDGFNVGVESVTFQNRCPKIAFTRIISQNMLSTRLPRRVGLRLYFELHRRCSLSIFYAKVT